MIINNTRLVKKTNKELVRGVFRSMGEATRAEISKVTGLSVATCGNIIKELLVAGEIWEGELVESSGGRPSRKFIYNSNFSLALCLFVLSDQKTHTLGYALVDLRGKIIEHSSEKYAALSFETIDSTIAEVVRKSKNIKAIGIGIPGMVSEGVVKYCDVESLNEIPVKERVEQKYNVDVIVENVMHLMVYGYYKNNLHLNEGPLAVLLAPEDHLIGAGFIIDGHILNGKSNLAGEIVYLPYGFSRSELIKRCANEETFIQVIVKAVSSIIPIINPAYLVLTGSLFKHEMVERIYAECSQDIPEEFLPEFLFKDNLEDEYLEGTIQLTLEAITHRSNR